MPFTGSTFTHLFDWEKDPQRQEKIVDSRLEAEFDGIDTGLSAVAADITSLEGSVRTKLTANRTYYVRTDGNDANDGLTNAAVGAFLTIQKAIDTVYGLDLNGNNVTIQVVNTSSPSTFAAGGTFSGAFVGKGSVTLVGDTTTPTNVVISVTGNSCLLLQNGVRGLNIGGFKLQTTSGGSGINLSGGSRVAMHAAMNYGAITGAAFNITEGSFVTVSANYTISGGGAYHIVTEQQSGMIATGRTITVSGTPAFSQHFIAAQNLGFAYHSGSTFSGAATGSRYFSTQNSVLNTGGGGANFYPGNVAGTTALGGQYI